MASNLFAQLMDQFKGKPSDYRATLLKLSKNQLEKWNRKHGTKVGINLNLQAIQSNYPGLKSHQIKERFLLQYLTPLGQAIEDLMNDKYYGSHFKEQFEMIEIVPGSESRMSILYNQGTLRLRKTFAPRTEINRKDIEALKHEFISVFQNNLIVYDKPMG